MEKARKTVGKSGDKPVLVKKVSVADTLALIKHGETVRFTLNDMNINSVRSCATRMNQAAGQTEFIVTAYENGAVYDVTRK